MKLLKSKNDRAVLPILFNQDMVEAILKGRKTQTRRIAKISAYTDYVTHTTSDLFVCWNNGLGGIRSVDIRCPYKAGDILYVRETWAKLDASVATDLGDGDYCYVHRASDNGRTWESSSVDWKWKPSIHMPREAARLFLKVTGVRAQQLKDITIEEIEKEGLYCDAPYTKDHFAYKPGMLLHWQQLWDSTLNPKELNQFGWQANPWVWVIDFEPTDDPQVKSTDESVRPTSV